MRVTDEAVRAAWEAEGPAGGQSYEEAAPRLRARLADEDLTRRIETWVKELRQSADVRYNGSEPAAGEPAS